MEIENSNSKILLAHGSGGALTNEFIENFILKKFSNAVLNKLFDSAIIEQKFSKNQKLAFTTDSYTVNPIFFPGGDIGKLSICGTINDLLCVGAIPIAISLSLIIQEGLDFYVVDKILDSIKKVSKKNKVPVVTGDTKVVEKNSCDKIFINTSAIGVIEKGWDLGYEKIKVGDKIIINGGIAEHGFAILLEREKYGFENSIKSDCTSLINIFNELSEFRSKIKFMRDPTRGGLAATLNEIVLRSKRFGIKVYEKKVPIKKQVKMVSEVLGIDPFTVANEGKIVLIVDEKISLKLLETLKLTKEGKNSQIIGEITKENAGKVIIETIYGAKKLMDLPYADNLPRIC